MIYGREWGIVITLEADLWGILITQKGNRWGILITLAGLSMGNCDYPGHLALDRSYNFTFRNQVG